MAADWPGFKCRRIGLSAVVWEGKLDVTGTAYTVRIDFALPPPPEAADERSQPRIAITEPPLVRRYDVPLNPLPHVYWLPDGDFRLCVYDPDGRDWTPADPIAQTIMYWTCRWLLRYEGWLATGKWHGKGRSHDPQGRYHPDDGTPLSWHDRWASTASDLAFRAAIPHPVDRRGWDQRPVPCFYFSRFRTAPVRRPIGR